MARKPRVQFAGAIYHVMARRHGRAALFKDDQDFYFTHPGHNDPGANCMFIASPETGCGAVIMTNGAQGLFLAIEIITAIVAEYDWPLVQAAAE